MAPAAHPRNLVPYAFAMADPTQLVTEYFNRVEAGRHDVADLFAEDAELVGLGTTVRGRPAIADFYAGVIANAGPSPELRGPLLAGGNRVAAEILVRVDGAPSVPVVDLFEADGGLITRLTYYVADPGSD